MSDASPKETATDHGKVSRLADHILPTSATMVGVCMTVISVLQLIPKKNISSYVDETLALDGLLFLGSAVLSYFSVRDHKSTERYERLADVLFLIALAMMAIVGLTVAFELLID